MFLRIAVGIGAWQIVSGFATVAETIRELSSTGTDSILTSFFDPLLGLHDMENPIIPRLKKMSLRR